jgi:branched-subunit amino acid aminotransferase/4-amino-4-deoxychorismate lyase
MRVLAVAATGPGVVDGTRPALDPLDLALVRGDAVFEALRVYGGRPFRLREHLDRLAGSAAALELALPGGLEDLAARAVAEAGDGDGVLRLICTRGPEGSGEPRRGAPVDREVPPAPDPEGLAASARGAGGPAAFAICTEVPASFETDRRRGVRLVLLTTAADPLVRAATANLWWRSGQTLFTPSLDLGILAGITRAVILELAPGLGLKVLEGVFTAEDLAAADEAFLSSSTREVMPVVEVDGAPIAGGHPGPAAGGLQTALRHLATA